MTDRPILFSAPMIRALLDGRKTQTRRPIYRITKDFTHAKEDSRYPPPLGLDALSPGEAFTLTRAVDVKVGDRLWVRETVHATERYPDMTDGVHYLADEVFIPIENSQEAADRWGDLYHYRRKRGETVPAIHMPRWASRLTLTVTDVRGQRLQEISEADAIAEGIGQVRNPDRDGYRHFGLPGEAIPLVRHGHGHNPPTASLAYGSLWDLINGVGCWYSNPWVVASTFTVEQRNIDA